MQLQRIQSGVHTKHAANTTYNHLTTVGGPSLHARCRIVQQGCEFRYFRPHETLFARDPLEDVLCQFQRFETSLRPLTDERVVLRARTVSDSSG